MGWVETPSASMTVIVWLSMLRGGINYRTKQVDVEDGYLKTKLGSHDIEINRNRYYESVNG
jgi:hypothetical protein